MSLVNIPSPCSEKIADMAQRGNGFYCASCPKVVVDFTEKTDAEVLEYLQSRNGQRTCGFFRNDQVSRRSNWPFEMVRFVAALALVFGGVLFMTSCTTTGESLDKQREDSVRKADSIAKLDEGHSYMLGEPIPRTDTTTTPPKQNP